MPTYCITRDPTLYPSPLEFRPLRFYELRQRGPDDAKARHQLTSTGPANLAFGYGASACPGRFFAAVAMKLILAHLLVHYEFRFPEGQAARPANVHVDERIWPDREQRVGFRGREPAGGGCFGCWEQKLMDRVYWWWWWWLRKAHTS